MSFRYRIKNTGQVASSLDKQARLTREKKLGKATHEGAVHQMGSKHVVRQLGFQDEKFNSHEEAHAFLTKRNEQMAAFNKERQERLASQVKERFEDKG